MLCNKMPHNAKVIGHTQLPWQQTAAETENTRLNGKASQCTLWKIKIKLFVSFSYFFFLVTAEKEI